MNRILRFALLISALAALTVALGFFLQQPWALSLWPLEASRLSNIFVASILAAIAAPILWIGLVGEARAMFGGALNLAVTFAGSSLTALFAYLQQPQAPLLAFIAFCFAAALLCIFLIAYSRHFQFHDRRPVPGFVRFSFLLFAVILAVVGTALVLRRPNIFPWPINPDTSAIYGWIFLGAMCYFVYALVRPFWGNARGQLLGFLAYDLVLIVPFIAHFSTVQPHLRVSLIIYTSVLVFSGLVSLFFLFLHPSTRF